MSRGLKDFKDREASLSQGIPSQEELLHLKMEASPSHVGTEHDSKAGSATRPSFQTKRNSSWIAVVITREPSELKKQTSHQFRSFTLSLAKLSLLFQRTAGVGFLYHAHQWSLKWRRVPTAAQPTCGSLENTFKLQILALKTPMA